ncbi:hypothetical protein [Corynebacterium kalidii]|uniref:PIN domain-containing protein n=1 Tax=Corynebacterium kalidii TaxID=2931982 RepID=A0A9X2B050_9CORY|nr:hypothetical protein [Corynebacterium kalidii]MCJ7859483.1 hypothetical protein [Corynebacterium kalidii]
MSQIDFIDTGILCNIVPVPKLDQHQESVRATMAAKMDRGVEFILPITTVIETGNHIAQVADGSARRTAAKNLDRLLRMVVDSQAPWTLHEIHWDRSFLERFLAGGRSKSSYIDHAQAKVGAGDLCILTERDIYTTRTLKHTGIWTLDEALAAHG